MTTAAAALSAAVWIVAVKKSHAIETVWLPAVVVGAAWPHEATKPGAGHVHAAPRPKEAE